MTIIKIRVIDCHIVYLGNKKPEFLMLKRSPKKIYPRIWQCVTGKIKKNEKPVDAAIRELREETGLKPKNKWTIEKVNHFYEPELDRMNIIPIFGIEVNSKKITLSDEHIDYKWCSINQAISLFAWNQQKEASKIFYKMLTSNKKILSFTKIK